jgi:hypothetical protein
MLSVKPLVNVNIDPFTGGNRLLVVKICKTCHHSACIASVPLFAMASCPCPRSPSFLNWKQSFCYCWVPGKSLCVAVPRRAMSDLLTESDLYGDWGIAQHLTPIYAISWTATHRFLLIFFPLTALQWRWWWARKKQSTIDRPTLYKYLVSGTAMLQRPENLVLGNVVYLQHSA